MYDAMVRFSFLSFSLVVLAGCAGAASVASDNRIETILREDGFYSQGLHERMTVVVSSREELAALWEQIFADRSPVPELPDVDFARQSIVMATPGMQSSGGFGVSIDSLSEVPEGMRLTITEISPGASCIVTEALTTPLHIVRLRRLPAVVLFDWHEVIRDCD